MEFEDVKQKNEVWKPTEVNEELIGKLVKSEDITIKDKETGEDKVIKMNVLSVDGNEIVLPTNKVLVDKLKNVEVGTTVKVTYQGEKQGSNEKLYKIYSVGIGKE